MIEEILGSKSHDFMIFRLKDAFTLGVTGTHFFVGFSQNITDCFSGQPFSGLGRRRWRHVSAPLFLRALLLHPPRSSQMRSPHAMLAVELVDSLHFFFLQAH
jgi:hypothetical protein